MKKGLIVVASLAAALLVAAPAISGSPATTSPGYNFTITVTLKDNAVILSRSVAKRGWRAHFVIANRGTKPHVFDIGGLKTPPIAPGQKRKLGAFLGDRGKYPYKVDRKIRGYFSVV
jgi:hypothetical protein